MTRAALLPGLCGVLWLLSGTAGAAEADPPQQTLETRNQVGVLAERVAKIEALLQNQTVSNLLKEVETLKSELSRLRGRDEMQDHQIESLGKRQGDLYVDLDKRMEDLNKQIKVAVPPPIPPAMPAVSVASADAATASKASQVQTPTAAVAVAAKAAATAQVKPEQAKSEQPKSTPVKPADPPEDALAESKSYETALNLFKTGNYAGAIADFKQFLKAYPDSTLAPNAQYWTGYAYYALKDYKNALEQQKKLVGTWPQSTKVPDALLNIASNQVELNDLASAKKNLEEIISKYPGTNAAAIANKRLALLR
jgi:tol-pal system protein YbgF